MYEEDAKPKNYSITSQGDRTNSYVVELIADDASDLETIPTGTLAPGSTCIVVGTSSVYMLNTKKEWVEL